ncbi:amidase domain-containing protein [Streptomyces sp. NPDC058439]|uniref:amidase domain-containing protein n=1 Tax=Streptomyces sp. NPDC058439 TaxID=3346500 RepID=UPI0036507F63
MKNKTYTWSAAENLRRHVTKYRHSQTISKASSAKVGDIIFFKWKKEKVYNHAAVVRSYSRGELHLVQHGNKDLTTLSDAITRNKKRGTPIEKILIVRVKDR